jgi:hypothetical protein
MLRPVNVAYICCGLLIRCLLLSSSKKWLYRHTILPQIPCDRFRSQHVNEAEGKGRDFQKANSWANSTGSRAAVQHLQELCPPGTSAAFAEHVLRERCGDNLEVCIASTSIEPNFIDADYLPYPILLLRH